MFLKSTLLTTAFLLTLTTAHFRVSYPPDRGASEENQGVSPCGGLAPSKTRTEWPLNGGRIEFEAGHDEAHTEVRLYVGDSNPSKDEDFNVLLVPVFNQIGLGTFCWDRVAVPNGTEGVKEGAKGTLVVRQAGHSSGWLYNCADIVFTADAAEPSGSCSNSTGIDAELLPGSDSDSDSTPKDDKDGGASTAKIAIGGLLGAMVVAVMGQFF